MFKVLLTASLSVGIVSAETQEGPSIARQILKQRTAMTLERIKAAKPMINSAVTVEADRSLTTDSSPWTNSISYNENTCKVSPNTNGMQEAQSGNACVIDSFGGSSYMAASCSDPSNNGNVAVTYNSYANIGCTAPATGTIMISYTPCESNGDGTYKMWSCSTGQPAITQSIGTEFYFQSACAAGDVEYFNAYSDGACIATPYTNGTFTKINSHCGFDYNTYSTPGDHCKGANIHTTTNANAYIFPCYPGVYDVLDDDYQVYALSEQGFCNSASSLLPKIGLIGFVAMAASGLITLAF